MAKPDSIKLCKNTDDLIFGLEKYRINVTDFFNLLKTYGLFEQKCDIIRTGRLAEFYCKWLFDVEIHKKENTPGHDGILENEKIEIKQRGNNADAELPVNLFQKKDEKEIPNFKWLFYVHLNKDTLEPEKINCYSYEDIKSWHDKEKANDSLKFTGKLPRITFDKIDFEPIFSNKTENK